MLQKQVGDLILCLVDRRADDMRGRFLGQLYDIFAQVGFHRRNAMGIQKFIQMNFLGDHGLALGHGLGIDRAADRQHRVTGIFRARAPVHLPAGGLAIAFKAFQIEIQIAQDMIL